MLRWNTLKPRSNIAEIEIPNIEDERCTVVIQVRDFNAYGLGDVKNFGPDVTDHSEARLENKTGLRNGEIWLQGVFIYHGA
jgi:hypothetical protein